MSARKRDEPVRLTRIYTRTGDAGETHLGDLSRVRKTDPLVEAYGAVDELNSVVGWVRVSIGYHTPKSHAELMPLAEQLARVSTGAAPTVNATVIPTVNATVIPADYVGGRPNLGNVSVDL